MHEACIDVVVMTVADSLRRNWPFIGVTFAILVTALALVIATTYLVVRM